MAVRLFQANFIVCLSCPVLAGPFKSYSCSSLWPRHPSFPSFVYIAASFSFIFTYLLARLEQIDLL